MAIWQCDFYILPSNSYEAVLNLETFDDSILWHKVSVNKEILNSVASVLPQVKSWSDLIDFSQQRRQGAKKMKLKDILNLTTIGS